MVPGLLLLAGLSAAASQVRSLGDLYARGEEGVWLFELNGERIGEHWLRYEGPAELPGGEAHRFTAGLHLLPSTAMPTDQRMTAELWVDAGGVPLRHVLRARVGDFYSSADVTVNGGKAHAVLVQGPTQQAVEVDCTPGAFAQVNNFVGYFEVMLGLSVDQGAEEWEGQFFSFGRLQGFPYKIQRLREFEEEWQGGVLHGAVFSDSLGEEITLAADGSLLKVAVPQQGLVIRRTAEAVEKFTVEPPEPVEKPENASFDREDVKVEHGEVSLAGTVTRPRGSTGRLPAVFFISGSGGQDRSGMSSGVDVGTHEILDRLTEEGYLVLRVDDRGVGQSKGPLKDIGFDGLIADARACVEYLLEREDVDPGRVAVIGHSEGGETAPILARELPEIAAIVLMAAPGRLLVDVIMDQNELGLRQSGVSGEDLETQLAEIRANLEVVCGDAEVPEDLPEEFRALLANRSWFQQHARRNPRDTIQEVECPVLILQGAKDFQVSAERDAEALAAALAEAGHPDYHLEVFPDLDHLFKKVPEGQESTLASYFQQRPVDPRFLEVLVDWLDARLKEDGAAER